ncbi:MAG: helix-turn-helix domain-containing protein [Pseudomonadota bacterium]
MSRYGQYCPLALAAEVLCERWNLLIIRRLIDGCERFTEIHSGVPKISATLLSSRLESLAAAGILVRTPLEGGRGHRYELTEAGLELRPLVDAIAVWGQRWAREMTTDDLDPEFLLYSMHRRIDSDAMPPGRTVIEFQFSRAPPSCRRVWLIHADRAVDMCLKYPGFEVDLVVKADLRIFIECWRGFRDLNAEISAARIVLEGQSALRRQFSSWLLRSAFAEVERLRPGKERRLQSRC